MEKTNVLMEQRKAELGGVVTPGSETRRQLSEIKPIADQFNFIMKVVGDIEKLSASLVA